MFHPDDFRYMSRALQLARTPIIAPHPNPRVGCVIVNNGEIVGEGFHEYAGGPHAEVNALAVAGDRAKGATVYLTLEPCCHFGRTPPCTDALMSANVANVVVAMEDPNPKVAGNGMRILREHGIAVESGLLQIEAEALNKGFIRRMREGRPWVRCKLAMSLDGRTAMSSGESQWITAPTARRDVQKLRAQSSAILTGIGTVTADDPFLTLRQEELGFAPTRQPARVVVDSQLRMNEKSRMLSCDGTTYIATVNADRNRQSVLETAGAQILHLPDKNGGVDLKALMLELGKREVNDVLVETGAILNGALLREGLLDEIIIYMAPILMGDSAKGLFELPGLGMMSQCKRLDITEIRAIGKDWRITAKPVLE